MAKVKTEFRQSGLPSITSYTFTDIAEGTGIVAFYGCDTYEEGARDYILTTNTPYSNNKFTGIIASGTGAETLLDLDFDVTFNIPKVVKGNVYANVTWVSGHTTTANKEGVSFIDFNVIHYDGTTETQLANATSESITSTSTTTETKTAFVKANVATAKQFKKGDTLRLNIQLKQTSGGSGGHEVTLFHDPQNRTVTATSGSSAIDETPDTTSLIFYVPFQIDNA